MQGQLVAWCISINPLNPSSLPIYACITSPSIHPFIHSLNLSRVASAENQERQFNHAGPLSKHCPITLTMLNRILWLLSKLKTDLLLPLNSTKWKSTGRSPVTCCPITWVTGSPRNRARSLTPTHSGLSWRMEAPAHHESPHWSGKTSINKNNSSPFHLRIVDRAPLKISPRKTEGEARIVVVTFIRESSTPCAL